LLTFVFASIAAGSLTVNQLYGQDPLDEMYGHAVHAFYRGDYLRSEEILKEVIAAGSTDPRAYYFRGLCQSLAGNTEASTADFEQGAKLEIDGKKVVNVGKALERIQGPFRSEIEKARAKARLASRSKFLELQRARYEETQRPGLTVPPRTGDQPPAPVAPAANDPFGSGLTRGTPAPMPNAPATTPAPAPDDSPFGEATDPAPEPAGDDPFGGGAADSSDPFGGN
jgi:hypothetical protein